MEQILIRPMMDADLPDVLRIENQSFAAPWKYEHFYHEIHNSDISMLFVAEQNSKLAGYMGLWILPQEMHITNIAVAPDFRRRGIAQLMLNAAFLISDKTDCREISLEVREGNTGAVALYQKNGFELVGRRKRYYQPENEDALILTKKAVRKS